MIGDDDIAQMQQTLEQMRRDHEVEITIRRGSTTLAPQPVRIARLGGQALTIDTLGGKEFRARVVVVGSTTLDIRPDDRFNDENGHLYRVIFVRPNRRAAVIAEAEMVE